MSNDVTIRPLRMDDVPALYESIRESLEDLSPWMPWCHSEYGISETDDWVEKQIVAFEAQIEFNFAIMLENQIVGVCGLNGISRVNQMANLGYWVRTSSCRRGVATQATRLLAEWAFRYTDLNRLEILVAIHNHPSLRVAAKAGAVWEGVLRGRLRLRDEQLDAVMFSIVRPDR